MVKYIKFGLHMVGWTAFGWLLGAGLIGAPETCRGRLTGWDDERGAARVVLDDGRRVTVWMHASTWVALPTLEPIVVKRYHRKWGPPTGWEY